MAKKGVPINFSQGWKYRHLSTTVRGKNFTIRQLKRRTLSAPRGSGLPVHSKLHWGIQGHQRVRKVGPNLYKVHLYGLKRQKGFTTKKFGRFIRPRRRF